MALPTPRDSNSDLTERTRSNSEPEPVKASEQKPRPRSSSYANIHQTLKANPPQPDSGPQPEIATIGTSTQQTEEAKKQQTDDEKKKAEDAFQAQLATMGTSIETAVHTVLKNSNDNEELTEETKKSITITPGKEEDGKGNEFTVKMPNELSFKITLQKDGSLSCNKLKDPEALAVLMETYKQQNPDKKGFDIFGKQDIDANMAIVEAGLKAGLFYNGNDDKINKRINSDEKLKEMQGKLKKEAKAEETTANTATQQHAPVVGVGVEAPPQPQPPSQPPSPSPSPS